MFGSLKHVLYLAMTQIFTWWLFILMHASSFQRFVQSPSKSDNQRDLRAFQQTQVDPTIRPYPCYQGKSRFHLMYNSKVNDQSRVKQVMRLTNGVTHSSSPFLTLKLSDIPCFKLATIWWTNESVHWNCIVWTCGRPPFNENERSMICTKTKTHQCVLHRS